MVYRASELVSRQYECKYFVSSSCANAKLNFGSYLGPIQPELTIPFSGTGQRTCLFRTPQRLKLTGNGTIDVNEAPGEEYASL
jgi:hypothetical protein